MRQGKGSMLCTYRAPVQGDKERTRQDGKCSEKGLVRGADGIEGSMGVSI